jgi:hypothetical protein
MLAQHKSQSFVDVTLLLLLSVEFFFSDANANTEIKKK